MPVLSLPTSHAPSHSSVSLGSAPSPSLFMNIPPAPAKLYRSRLAIGPLRMLSFPNKAFYPIHPPVPSMSVLRLCSVSGCFCIHFEKYNDSSASHPLFHLVLPKAWWLRTHRSVHSHIADEESRAKKGEVAYSGCVPRNTCCRTGFLDLGTISILLWETAVFIVGCLTTSLTSLPARCQ